MMSTDNEKDAAVTSEPRPDAEASKPKPNFITSALIGQIFRLASAVTMERLFVYASLLNGKVDLTLICRGHRYEILTESTTEAEFRKAIDLLEDVQRLLICKDLI